MSYIPLIQSYKTTPFMSPNEYYEYYKSSKKNNTINGKHICGCCDESIYQLVEKPLEVQINGIKNKGVKNILQCNNVTELDENGKEIIMWCVDYLLFNKKYPSKVFLKKNIDKDTVHKHKYLTIWSFIYDFLKIPKDSGYDYYVMMWLQWNNICDHGSAIRYAWFNTESANPYLNRKLPIKKEQTIQTWCENFED